MELTRTRAALKFSNKEIEATSFNNGNQKAVVLTQSYSDELSTDLIVPGYSYVGHDGTGDFTLKNDKIIKLTLKRDALAIVILER